MMFGKSHALFDRARKVTTGGAQTGSKAPGRVGPLGAFPLYLDRGEGAYVWDVDGNQYIDFFNGNCAVTLGHGHPDVARAVLQAATQGVLLSLPSRLEVEVAEQLVEILPGAEQVRFVKTGSEACAAAVRLARMATGRAIILTVGSGYHGWHDWFTVLREAHPGVPDWYLRGVQSFDYDDLESLDAAAGDWSGVAAIMLEPTLTEAPAPGFLQAIRDRADAHGALLIFDEMICGNRWAVGGGAEYFGVTPDLATYGKAFANGLPLAFVAGRADVMQHAWAISGTFGGETVALAACQEVLRAYRQEPVIARVWDVGRMLMDAVNGVCRRLNLPAEMIGYPCRPVLRWLVDDWARDTLIALFQQELAVKGILAHPSGWNPSYAHDHVALGETLLRVTRAIETVAHHWHSGSPAAALKGELLRPAFARVTS